MELLIRQRVFSWADTYDVYDAYQNPVYFVKAEFWALGHQIYLYDGQNRPLASIHEKLFRLLPEFDIVIGGYSCGTLKKEWSILRPRYTLDCNGWRVQGDVLGWDYDVVDDSGNCVLHIAKEPLNWGDTYVLHIPDPAHTLLCLMIAIAIDAANCADD
ncbi:MAG: LURP-one-related family protein [Clostridiales bacterium]|nr:LURP-one-related family protein [Clostridiales bacterium]